MKMKKKLFSIFAALLALSACQKVSLPSEEGKTYDLSRLRLDFTIEQGEATKGVRTGWQNGDKVFIFFENINSAYAVVEFDGSAWSAVPVIPSPMETPALASSGFLTAVYLPYGNTLTPVWDGTANAWTFSGTFSGAKDCYYLKSEKASFFITDMENVLPTLGAYLYMDTAERFVQFFVPDEEATGTIQLACNSLVPAGISGVSLDGSVTETALSQGGWVTAHAETFGGEKGYYASGKLASRPGLLYYFAINAGGNYQHYYKQRTSTLVGRGAYQLPAREDWLTISSSVKISDNSWSQVNAGALNPWELGTSYAASGMDAALQTNTLIPSDVEWSQLLDRARVAWIQASILGVDGFLVVDRRDESQFFFLPCADYWSSSAAAGTQHYFKTANDGTHEIPASFDSLGSAYVRLISSIYGGNINPPEDGGNI